MLLAQAWCLYRTETRADLQRYYGLNIERMGKDFSIWHAAACVACLPLGSRLMQAIDPKAQYSQSDYLLHRLGDFMAQQHIPYPWEMKDKKVADFGTMEIESFKRWHASKFAGGE